MIPYIYTYCTVYPGSLIDFDIVSIYYERWTRPIEHNRTSCPVDHVHRLRPIDIHLELYTMLYNNSSKNRYAEPFHNNSMRIFKIR